MSRNLEETEPLCPGHLSFASFLACRIFQSRTDIDAEQTEALFLLAQSLMQKGIFVKDYKALVAQTS